MVPKGKPTTSAERMRLKRLRELGELPQLPTCQACGKRMKPNASQQSRAAQMGLCWACWKETPEGKLTRRRQGLKREVFPVAYFGNQPDEEPHLEKSMRKALTASVTKRGEPNEPIFICWSTGLITCHHGLTASTAYGVEPDDGEELQDGDPAFFHDQVPDQLKTWFEH